MPQIGGTLGDKPYGPGNEDYEYDGKVGRDMDNERNDHVAEPFRSILNGMTVDQEVSAILHSQKVARQIGANQMAVEVYGWALKHGTKLPAAALAELMDIVAGQG